VLSAATRRFAACWLGPAKCRNNNEQYQGHVKQHAWPERIHGQTKRDVEHRAPVPLGAFDRSAIDPFWEPDTQAVQVLNVSGGGALLRFGHLLTISLR
jgi:hypothetical protein